MLFEAGRSKAGDVEQVSDIQSIQGDARNMSKKPEPFKVPVGLMMKMCRSKVKRPQIASFRLEGRNLIAVLSCGHEHVYCRIPKWTTCWKCPTETTHFEEPIQGFKEVPFTTEKIQ